MVRRMRLNTLLDIMIMMLLCIMFKASMTGYFKKFNENATMSFTVNNKQLLKKLQ